MGKSEKNQCPHEAAEQNSVTVHKLVRAREFLYFICRLLVYSSRHDWRRLS